MRYSVARYLGIDSAASPTFAVGASAADPGAAAAEAAGPLVCLADTTGTPQAYRLDNPGARPARLTAHDERLSFVAASPTRPEVAFGMDQGSDERDQLFRYDLAEGAETALTDRPDAVHSWGGWSPDGDRVAFAANRRDPGTFDVYVQARTGTEATLVHEGAGGFLDVAAWSPDGDALVCRRSHASLDQELLWVPLDGAARSLTGDGPEARYPEVAFGPEGDLLCLTDRGRDTHCLARIGLETGAVTVVEDGSGLGDGGWNLDELAVDRERGRVAVTRNVGGDSTLHVGRLTNDGGGAPTLSVAASPPVDGVVSGLTFDGRGERLAVARSADDRPRGVSVVDVAAAVDGGAGGDGGGAALDEAITPWIDPGTLGIPRERLRRSETVRYESFDGREIPAYWTLPEGADAGDPVPAVVDVHGGPTHQRRPWFSPVKQFLLEAGYAVFEPNVRGSSGYGRRYAELDDRENRLDSVRDLDAAAGWLADHPAVDGDRIVVYGRSYGGFMVLSAITRHPERWAAAVEFVGIADFETFLENTGEWRRSHREREYGSLENRDLLERVSPIHDVDRIECPLFVQHGANDPRVPVEESEQIADAVAERGVPVETLIFEDEGHHTTDRANRVEQFERIVAFLDEHVPAER